MRIIYVDDDVLMLKAVRRQLVALGHEVQTAECPQSATCLAACADVALLDWDPHGPTMLKRCRAAGMPAVIYTGEVERAGQAALLIVPAITVLGKPATAEQLDAALRGAR